MGDLINSVCLRNDDGKSDTKRVSDICSGGTWAMVCVVHSDGMSSSSSSSSGASRLSSTKSGQILGFYEGWRRSKGVDPCAK